MISEMLEKIEINWKLEKIRSNSESEKHRKMLSGAGPGNAQWNGRRSLDQRGPRVLGGTRVRAWERNDPRSGLASPNHTANLSGPEFSRLY